MQTVATNVTIYKCNFCTKRMQRKHAMVEHEKWCIKNPVNAPACYCGLGCKHMEIQDIDTLGEMGFYRHNVKTPTCNKLNVTMYSIAAERRDLPQKHPEHFCESVPMPITCEHYEQKD